MIEANTDGIQVDEDLPGLAALSLDASGLAQTLHVLEGIAVEGNKVGLTPGAHRIHSG